MSPEERLGSRLFIYNDGHLTGGFAISENAISFGYKRDGFNHSRITKDTLKMRLRYSKVPDAALKVILLDPKTAFEYLKDCHRNRIAPHWDLIVGAIQDTTTFSPFRGSHVVTLADQQQAKTRR